MNKVYDASNGSVELIETTELSPNEVVEMAAQEANAEKHYWQSVNYDEAVDIEIRKKYSVSQEFAILRQRDEKPGEYAEYYNYCEECKAYVKEMKEI